MAGGTNLTPNRSQISELQQAQEQAAMLAKRELGSVWAEISDWEPARQRDALLELVPAIIDKYADTSSTAAAEWYQQVRDKWISDDFKARTPVRANDDISKLIRAKAGVLFGDDTDPMQMLRFLNGVVDKGVKQGGRDAIRYNAKRDPKKPRYARVPEGPACAFCTMLASRGFIYQNEDTAGGLGQYHNDCHCEIIPSWDGDKPYVEGYDADGIEKRYEKCRDAVERLLTKKRYDEYKTKAELDGDEHVYRFDEWVTRQILAEMRWRDRRWLYDGTEPQISFPSNAMRKETEAERPQEIRTAQRLRKHGIAPVFQIDYRLVMNEDGIEQRIGLADWAGGIEIKTPDRAKSFRSIDGFMGSASKKADCTRLIIDNSENLNMTDDQLVGFIMRSHRFKRGIVYILSKESELKRIK